MGRFLGSWDIDDVLRVHIQTSSVTTGAATDADAAPSWRVYEDDTATPVTTGTFSTLNAQTGFYVAAITLAAAIGYEVGKSYAIRTQATVASIIGADVHSFQIQSEVRLAAGAITAGTITDGAFTSPKFGAGFITAGSITDGAFTSPKFGAGFITAGSISAGALSAAKFAADAIAVLTTVGATAQAAIADAVWDEAKAGHTTADTYGEYLDATVSGVSGGAGDTTVSPTAIAAIADAVWDETGSDHTSAGSFGGRLNVTINSMTAGAIGPVTVGSTSQAAIAVQVTAGSIGAVTVGATSQSAISAAVTAGSIGAVTVGSTSATAIQSGLATQASVDTIDDFLDTEIAAIKAKTDSLTFTVAGHVDANVQRINDVVITGDGQVGTEFGV
jgi:hypothetical protein